MAHRPLKIGDIITARFTVTDVYNPGQFNEYVKARALLSADDGGDYLTRPSTANLYAVETDIETPPAPRPFAAGDRVRIAGQPLRHAAPPGTVVAHHGEHVWVQFDTWTSPITSLASSLLLVEEEKA